MSIEIKSTLKPSPIRAVIAGKDGVGKSTFCAAAPGAVFIAVEDGLSNIAAMAVDSPKTWPEVIDAIDALAVAPACQTIVIDSIDWLEGLCWSYVCTFPDDKGKKHKDIEGFGFGKGYVAALTYWRALLAACDRARKAGKNILLIAHSERKTIKNPVGEDYDSYVIKLHTKTASLIREWADVVGFAELDVAVYQKDKQARFKGISSGKRVLRTQPHAGYDTKTRFSLPDRIPLDWPTFERLVKEGKPPTVQELQATLEKKLDALGDATLAVKCMDFLAARGRNFTSLSEAIATVDDYANNETKEE